MKSVKVIAGFGIFGFLLSFLTGLIAGRKFSHIIIDALIFLFVFAAIGALIYFFAAKIILSPAEGDSLSDSVSDQRQSSPSSSSQAVDILVEDEDLPEEENASQFFVGTNHQMLNDGDLSSSSPDTGSGAEYNQVSPQNVVEKKEVLDDVSKNNEVAFNSVSSSDGFVPMPLAETRKNISGTEAKTLSEVKQSESENESGSYDQGGGSEELGVLPDLEDIAGAPSAPGASLDQTSDEDSSSSWENSNKSGSSDASEVTEGKDAALMAKAISTLLAKED